jgi:nitroreductase
VAGYFLMDVRLAITSRREVRLYAPKPLAPEVADRILDAGRLAGSSRNRQPWTFVVVDSPKRLEQLSSAVYEPSNVLGAALVVAIVVRGKGPVSFDAGRAAQNMLLQAWSDGVGATPNGISDPDAAAEVLEVEDEDDKLAIVLSFGYPEQPKDPGSRSPDEWSARANRRALDDVVRRLA